MNLQLTLKRKWFEMTKSGVKTEDYREITPYWIKRLVNPLPKNMAIGYLNEKAMIKGYSEERGFKPFKTNTMTLGYPKKGDPERTLVLKHAGIEIRKGNPEWGAEPDRLYFVIKHIIE